jgi:hypothetical protein
MAAIAAGWPTSLRDNAFAISLAESLDRVLNRVEACLLDGVSLTPLLCEGEEGWKRLRDHQLACFGGLSLWCYAWGMNRLGDIRRVNCLTCAGR